MRQSRYYLCFNVLLDIGPWLAILWRSIWEEFLQVSWLDAGEDAAMLYRVIVIDD
jgi:hypothetical protein